MLRAKSTWSNSDRHLSKHSQSSARIHWLDSFVFWPKLILFIFKQTTKVIIRQYIHMPLSSRHKVAKILLYQFSHAYFTTKEQMFNLLVNQTSLFGIISDDPFIKSIGVKLFHKYSMSNRIWFEDEVKYILCIRSTSTWKKRWNAKSALLSLINHVNRFKCYTLSW